MSRLFWVYIEQEDGIAHPVSWELLGEARLLAEQVNAGQTDPEQTAVVEGILLGENVDPIAREAVRYGAQRVRVLDHPGFRHYLNRPYAEGLVTLVRRHQPEVFLVGATTTGRDLAGSVATSLGTGLTADCTQLQMGEVSGVDRKVLMSTRPAFGGNIIATILCRHRLPQMSTVRPRVFCIPSHNPEAEGEIVREDPAGSEAAVNAKIVEFIANQAARVKLEYADVIVSGGRGLGKPSGFDLVRELAEVLGGVVGSSRGCVDAGWIPYEHQVGQTGRTVRPKLYVALGISGAIQHKVGMQDSDFILAINIDPHAPIFDIASVGIVGDLYTVVPELIRQIRATKGASHA
jgi:electron transfer flavoprotein alpha subunit